MNEFFNWNDSWILVEYHWIWLLAAFCIGMFFAHHTRDNSTSQDN